MTGEEFAQRSAVAAEARTWLRTPYHHRGRIKGVGVDCALFPASVYEAVGLIDHVDPAYVQDWHLHRNRDLFVEWVLRVGAREIPRDAVGMGDLGVWRWGRAFSHGAIVLTPPQVIHSYVEVGVTLDDMNSHEELRRREARFFSFW